MKPAPPYLTQAWRSGQHVTWITDSRHDTLELAIAAANTLRVQFDRTVRVIDQNEHVHFALGTQKEARAKGQ